MHGIRWSCPLSLLYNWEDCLSIIILELFEPKKGKKYKKEKQREKKNRHCIKPINWETVENKVIRWDNKQQGSKNISFKSLWALFIFIFLSFWNFYKISQTIHFCDHYMWIQGCRWQIVDMNSCWCCQHSFCWHSVSMNNYICQHNYINSWIDIIEMACPHKQYYLKIVDK